MFADSAMKYMISGMVYVCIQEYELLCTRVGVCMYSLYVGCMSGIWDVCTKDCVHGYTSVHCTAACAFVHIFRHHIGCVHVCVHMCRYACTCIGTVCVQDVCEWIMGNYARVCGPLICVCVGLSVCTWCVYTCMYAELVYTSMVVCVNV